MFLDHWSRKPDLNRAYGAYAYTRFPLILTHMAVLNPDGSYWADTDVPILSSNLTRLSNSRQLIGTIKEYLDSRECDTPPRGKTVELPPELRGGFYRVDFTLPVDRTTEIPVLGFEAFKTKFARPKPKDEEWTVSNRSAGGYVGVDSLELMAIDCDVIVRGVMEDSCFLGADSYAALGLKLRVLETLKGKCASHIGVLAPCPSDLDQLRRDPQELIVFLQSQRLSMPAAVLGYRTRGGLWDDAVIVLDDQKAEVLFADMSWHRRPTEILHRLRVVVDRERKKREATDDGSAPFEHHGTRPPVFWFHPPSSLVKGSVIEGNLYSRIYLPVDKELETNARQWAVSANQDRRWLAARAMIYFKSDENAAILMKLLDDDATWGRRDMLHMMENLPYPHDPKYLVRWEAWHVLAGWGYDVSIPSFGESRSEDRSPKDQDASPAKELIASRPAPSIFRNRGRHVARVVRKIAGVAERWEGSRLRCRWQRLGALLLLPSNTGDLAKDSIGLAASLPQDRRCHPRNRFRHCKLDPCVLVPNFPD